MSTDSWRSAPAYRLVTAHLKCHWKLTEKTLRHQLCLGIADVNRLDSQVYGFFVCHTYGTYDRCSINWQLVQESGNFLTMGYEKGKKLNRLQRLVPPGLVVTAAWLSHRGYSSALLRKYVARRWLEQPARGVYRRPAGELLWQQVVVSLQTLLEIPAFVGGRTALEQQGLTHYVSESGAREVHLYFDALPPGWLKKLRLNESLVLHRTKRLFKTPRRFRSGEWSDERHTFSDFNLDIPDDLSLQSWGQWDWPLVMSKPERAVLELIDEVPEHESFHQADMLIEGLRTLSPRRMQILLEECNSVKVKRLFLWFAERHQSPWVKELNYEHIDLGAGKRSLVPGGKLDRKYLITVPEDMHGNQ